MIGSWGPFVRHYIEMVAAMIVGMLVLGEAVSFGLGLFGHTRVLDDGGLMALVMSVNMTIGMSLWMLYRGHAWRPIGEMGAAMVLPFVALIGPYWARVLSPGGLMLGIHILMLPAMLAVMLYRRTEYGLPLAGPSRTTA